MKEWRSRAGMLLYVLATTISVLGTIYLVWIHMHLWITGNFILGAFSVVLVLEYVLASLTLWALGNFFIRRPKMDYALLLLTIVPIVILLVVPARFAVN